MANATRQQATATQCLAIVLSRSPTLIHASSFTATRPLIPAHRDLSALRSVVRLQHAQLLEELPHAHILQSHATTTTSVCSQSAIQQRTTAKIHKCNVQMGWFALMTNATKPLAACTHQRNALEKMMVILAFSTSATRLLAVTTCPNAPTMGVSALRMSATSTARAHTSNSIAVLT